MKPVSVCFGEVLQQITSEVCTETLNGWTLLSFEIDMVFDIK